MSLPNLNRAGVWTRDLKVHTNLAQPQVTKMSAYSRVSILQVFGLGT
jgi:hypothetical protein